MSKLIRNSINRFIVGLIRDAVYTEIGAHNTKSSDQNDITCSSLHYFLLLGPKNRPQKPILEHPAPCSSP